MGISKDRTRLRLTCRQVQGTTVEVKPYHALLKAIKRNVRSEVVEALVAAKGNLDAPHAADEKANGVLHVACHYGSVNIARLLLQAKADPNGRNGKGHTALHFGARSGSHRICKLLAENRAQLDAKNADGVPPIRVSSDPFTRKVLEQLGAKREEGEAVEAISPPVSPTSKGGHSPGSSPTSRSPSPVRRKGPDDPCSP